MDIDSTIKALSLNEEAAVRNVNEIIRIHIEDGTGFEIVKTTSDSEQIEKIVNEISADEGLLNLWDLYKNDNFYVGDIKWTVVCEAVCTYIRNNISK